MKINRIIIFLCFCFLFGGDIDRELKIAGKNKNQIKKALRKVPKVHRAGMEWLIKHMPEEDLKNVTSDFLLENCELAYNFLLYTSPSPRDGLLSRMPSSA